MKLTTNEIQSIVGCAAGVDSGYCTKRKWYNRNETQHNLTDLRETLELRQEVERLKVEAIKLLDAAICPCCDKSGAYYDNYGKVCQCQWCDEVKQLREQGDE